MFVREDVGDTGQLGFHLRQRYARAETSEHADRYPPATSARKHWIGMLQRIRDIDVHWFRDAQRRIVELEPWRQHSDH